MRYFAYLKIPNTGEAKPELPGKMTKVNPRTTGVQHAHRARSYAGFRREEVSERRVLRMLELSKGTGILETKKSTQVRGYYSACTRKEM